jgi:hypothetical protein
MKTDVNNCGACGNKCGTNTTCTDGVCGCAASYTDCDSNATDNIVACTDVTKDAKHCGSCTKSCGDNATCSASACACASGFTDCTGKCIDTKEDPLNCSACGTKCTLDMPYCNGSKCEAAPCSTYTDITGQTTISSSAHTCYRITGAIRGGGIYSNDNCKAWVNGSQISNLAELGASTAINGYTYIEVEGCSLAWAAVGFYQ